MSICFFFFFSSRRRHTRSLRDWSSDVCSSDLFASRDVEANKKIFVNMGGTPITGGNETVLFPGVRINLSLGNAPGSGESVGSVVNHVGFIVKNVQEQVAKWKANGVPVLPGTNNRLDQAFVVTPDGVRIEILEDKTQIMPIRHEHVH